MGNRTANLGWTTLITASTSDVFIPASGWMSTAGFRQFRPVVEIADRTGGIDVTPAYQVANTYDDPQAFHGMGATLTSDGYHFPAAYTDPTSGTSNVTEFQLVRFGYKVSVASGTGHARVAASVQIVTE